ncbi:MAG: molecular chaperone HtpG, partial [Muribaculaceae bacterium]|nr:molecular chaperone HtpG [Muribaculaceae bacterium]
FCDAAMKFTLLEDTSHKFYTLEEYKTLVEPEQTEKDGNIVYLYTTDPTAQYNYIKAANDKGYNVLLMDGQLDSHFVQLLEHKLEKTRLVRVDSDVIDRLIRKDDGKTVDLTATQRNILTTLFQSSVPEVENTMFMVEFEAMGAEDMPIVITQNEYMRRMKDMAAMQPGMNFYGEMPDSYTLVVNTSNKLIEDIRDKATAALDSQIKPLEETVEADNKKIEEIRSKATDGKLDAEAQKQTDDLVAQVNASRDEQQKLIKTYAQGQPVVRQLIDLALLGNGLLKGKDLSDFIARSVSMIK